jgi:large subunit ribosomal protein L32
MAVPKRKTSKARKNKRRASSYRLSRVTISSCPPMGMGITNIVCKIMGYNTNLPTK